MDQPEANIAIDVSLFAISQATTATFTDLYFQHTFLFFVQVGSKRIVCPSQGELIGHAGDVIICSPGAIATMQNRPVLNRDYRAVGVCFAHHMIAAVFSEISPHPPSRDIQIVRAGQQQSVQVLAAIQSTLHNTELPPPIKQHRLLEPLVWLKYQGVSLSPQEDETLFGQVRRLIATDLSHPWRSPEVAKHFAMSEATLRRGLAKSGHSFSKMLHKTRLEQGLSLLQSTELPIAAIALHCGFKSPSHFSDSFKKRFGIKPSAIRTLET